MSQLTHLEDRLNRRDFQVVSDFGVSLSNNSWDSEWNTISEKNFNTKLLRDLGISINQDIIKSGYT